MTRTLSSLISLLILFLAFALPASAQFPATGTPASGSFSGGPDVINVGNLNAHLDIPIIRKPGRGANFNYDLTYDSSVWYPAGSSGSQSWLLFLNSTPLGWQGFNGAEPGGIVYTLSIGYSDPHSPCSVTQYSYSNFSYWDSTGTPHPFSFFGEWLDGSGQGGCPPTGPMPAAPWTGVATDGSGYSLSLTPSQVFGYNPTFSAVLLDKNGKTIGAPVTQQPPPPFVGGQDRNGNLATASNGTVTDTLGTSALTLFGVAPSNTTFSYTAPSGATASYTVKYQSYTVQSNFGCSGISEYGPTANNLVSEIDLPDIAVNPNDKYTFSYEPTPGHSSNVTGRLKSVILPTGGTISYTYTNGNLTGSVVGSTDPIVCADGTTAGLQRSTPDTGANYWSYARTQVSGKHWQTTITDPTTNQTVVDFQQDSNIYGGYNFFATQRKTYQGSASGGTLLQTVISCYNGNTSSCPTTAVSSPFTQKTVYTQWPSGLESENNVLYNIYGLPTEQDDYDYGSGSPGGLLRKTLTTYASLGNGIVSMPASISVQNVSGATVAKQTFTYDQGTPTVTSGTPQHNSISGSRGNVTTANYYTNTSAYLTKTFTYFDTGNVQTATDVNGGVTTNTYSSPSASCGNSFPTGVTEAITSLTQSTTWNCTGGVQLTSVDENNRTTTALYNDAYFWRPASVTDPTGAANSFCYGLLSSSTGTCTPNPSQTESTLNFNSNNSTVDSLATLDNLGRSHVQQTRQSPSLTTFDSAEADYDALGRPTRSTVPYSGSSGQTNSSAPALTTMYDGLGRALSTTDANNGTTTYSYSNNDVLVTVGPAPSGEHTKQRQLEYDALGRLTSVCEITAGASPWLGGTCAQKLSQTGYWTKYSYDALGDLLTVTQNAQSTSNQQTRSYVFDSMSRLMSETNPESGATSYTYDSDTTCSYGSSGDLIKRVDAVGNTSCFTYDALHRALTVTYPSGTYASVTLSKHFVYDAATVNSVAMTNAKSRLAEAYTTSSSCTSKCTDIGFSYTARGEASDVYELTPHSNSSYYHVSQSYWPHGVTSQLSSSISLPTISYGGTIASTVGLDGEGRITQVTASGTGQQNPVTGVTYNNSTLPTQVNFGSGDNDVFAYDPNTIRTTQYQFNINGQSSTGALTWNPNGSLQKLAITDAFNSSDNQTCNYANDDLSRIASANCGSAASQTFSYDPFGNISKSGSPYAFQPTYNSATNRFATVPGATPTYDANGNVTYDGSHNYTWDADGNSVSIDSVGLTFDALDRMVEQNRSGTYTEIVYSPGGAKLALMSGTGGQTLQKAFVPLPGQATAVYTSSGLDHYRHSDWLGSARLTSSATRTVVSTTAYAPFGEPYVQSGTSDLSFTGQNTDTTSGAGDYDFLYREYSIQGRFPSPDPAGLVAGSPGYPQSWNRYAYVQNNPLALTDPQGLDCIYGGSYVNGAVGEYQADSGVYIVPGDNCVSDDDNGLYVDGTVTSTQLDSNGNLTYSWIGSDENGNPAIWVDSAGNFANWDWSQADSTVQANILAISQVLAPLNKLSDCTGQAIANEVPLVGKKLFGAPNPDPVGNKARSLSKALSPNPNAKLFGVIPSNYATNTQRVVTGLDKLDLPVLSEGTANIAAKFAPYAPAFSKFLGVAAPAFMAGNATRNTYACYNKP